MVTKITARLWVLSIVSTVLTACVAPPTQLETIALGIPDQLPTYASSETISAPQLQPSDHWQDFFTDSKLQQLIQQTLVFNSDLKAATARVAEARALHGIQAAERLPHIGTQAEVQRGRVPADMSITQQAETSSQYQLGLGVNAFELDFWGRVSALTEAALAQYLATEQAKKAFEISLIAMTADAYLQALELAERVDLAQKTVATRTESQRIMKHRVQVGSSSDLELRSVDSLLLAARSELANLEREKAQNLAFLQQLSGTVPTLTTDNRLADQTLERSIQADMSSSLLLQRPDIQMAEQQLQAAQASVKAARAAFFPQIKLTGLAGTASTDLEGLFRGGSAIWSFIPRISLPIFDGGTLESNLALAEARQHLAVANYESAIRTAFKEVADGLAAHHWLAEQEKAQQLLVLSEQDRAHLATLRYEQGSAAYLEVLDAQRSQFVAEQALLQLQRARLSNVVTLYKALGGGV